MGNTPVAAAGLDPLTEPVWIYIRNLLHRANLSQPLERHHRDREPATVMEMLSAGFPLTACTGVQNLTFDVDQHTFRDWFALAGPALRNTMHDRCTQQNRKQAFCMLGWWWTTAGHATLLHYDVDTRHLTYFDPNQSTFKYDAPNAFDVPEAFATRHLLWPNDPTARTSVVGYQSPLSFTSL